MTKLFLDHLPLMMKEQHSPKTLLINDQLKGLTSHKIIILTFNLFLTSGELKMSRIKQ